jgi:hypothetical protein
LMILPHFTSFPDPCEFSKTRSTQAEASTIRHIWQECSP